MKHQQFNSKKIFFLTICLGLLVTLDQWSKNFILEKLALGESIPLIDGFFNLTLILNRGVAFGIGAESSPLAHFLFIILLPILLCFFIFYLITKAIKEKKNLALSAYTLILSGAIGNLIDRIGRHFVVDFLDFYYGNYHYPAFNVADSCITVGVILLLIENLFFSSQKLFKE